MNRAVTRALEITGLPVRRRRLDPGRMPISPVNRSAALRLVWTACNDGVS
jgi:hypothetical protein